MHKLQEWLFNVENEKKVNEIICDHYFIDNYKIVDSVGRSLKQQHIVICQIDNSFILRSLDYINGICYALNYKHILLDK